MEPRLHHLQREAGLVTDVVVLLQEFAREKLAALLQHQVSARHVAQYDVNNTYQYIINREEAQLSWVAKAIEELGGTVPADPSAPTRTPAGKGADAARAAIEQDARDADAFVERWRARIDAMPNARHARMLRVVLGEVLEARR